MKLILGNNMWTAATYNHLIANNCYYTLIAIQHLICRLEEGTTTVELPQQLRQYGAHEFVGRDPKEVIYKKGC